MTTSIERNQIEEFRYQGRELITCHGAKITIHALDTTPPQAAAVASSLLQILDRRLAIAPFACTREALEMVLDALASICDLPHENVL
jgi:hypothetical protein